MIDTILVRLKPLRQRSRPATYLYYTLPILALISAVIYSGWHANFSFSNIQDALLYPYLFDGFRLDNLILPGQHANILKFPLFWLQSVLPYNFTTLTIINIGLYALTVTWWTVLLAKVFGKKYLPLICTLFAVVLFGSTTLGTNLIETTIRNIEYPLGLSFILVINALLKKSTFTKKEIVLGVATSILFALAIAGDNFLLYAFCAPLLISFVLFWVQKGHLDKQIIKAFGAVILTVILGILIRKFVALSNIADLYFNPVFDTKTLPIESFGPSLTHAFSQLTSLFGANVFYASLGLGSAVYFFNLLFLLVGLVGLLMMLITSVKAFYKNKNIYGENRFIFTVLAASFITTFGAYIFSGMALIKLPDGNFIDASQIRFLTLLPFLVIAGVVFIIQRYYKKRNDIVLAIIILGLISILASLHNIRSSQNYITQYDSMRRNSITDTVKAAKDNDVTTVLSGDGLGAPIRFWSQDSIQYASIMDCDKTFLHNIRKDWYVPTNKPITIALVVDTTGYDAQNWKGCTTERLRKIYGKPAKVVYVKNPPGTKPIELWIYHQDIRQNVLPH